MSNTEGDSSEMMSLPINTNPFILDTVVLRVPLQREQVLGLAKTLHYAGCFGQC